MLTAVIVDDEPLARQELEYLLERTGEVEILALGANGIEAVTLIRAHKPDVVFLDVQMPGLDGFAVLKKLLGKAPLDEAKAALPQVVFATAFDHYAVRAFEVNAVDYLLKPYSYERVQQTVAKSRERLTATAEAAPAQPQMTSEAKLDALLRLVEERAGAPQTTHPKPSGKVIVRAQSRLLLVDQKEICFAAIEDGTISVVTPTVEGQSNCRTLEELMLQLNPDAFWRAHRSFLVNLQHIREVVPWFKSSYQLRMDDPRKTEIPVSRSQTKRLRELFNL